MSVGKLNKLKNVSVTGLFFYKSAGKLRLAKWLWHFMAAAHYMGKAK
jgi:hypothetical protein